MGRAASVVTAIAALGAVGAGAAPTNVGGRRSLRQYSLGSYGSSSVPTYSLQSASSGGARSRYENRQPGETVRTTSDIGRSSTTGASDSSLPSLGSGGFLVIPLDSSSLQAATPSDVTGVSSVPSGVAYQSILNGDLQSDSVDSDSFVPVYSLNGNALTSDGAASSSLPPVLSSSMPDSSEDQFDPDQFYNSLDDPFASFNSNNDASSSLDGASAGGNPSVSSAIISGTPTQTLYVNPLDVANEPSAPQLPAVSSYTAPVDAPNYEDLAPALETLIGSLVSYIGLPQDLYEPLPEAADAPSPAAAPATEEDLRRVAATLFDRFWPSPAGEVAVQSADLAPATEADLQRVGAVLFDRFWPEERTADAPVSEEDLQRVATTLFDRFWPAEAPAGEEELQSVATTLFDRFWPAPSSEAAPVSESDLERVTATLFNRYWPTQAPATEGDLRTVGDVLFDRFWPADTPATEEDLQRVGAELFNRFWPAEAPAAAPATEADLQRVGAVLFDRFWPEGSPAPAPVSEADLQRVASTLFNSFWPEGGSAPVSEADLQRVGAVLFDRLWPEGSPAPAPVSEADLQRVGSTLFNRFWPEGGSAPVSEADLQRVGAVLFDRLWPEGSPAPAPVSEADLQRVGSTLFNRFWPEGGSAPVSEADLQRVGAVLFDRLWPEGSPAPAPVSEADLQRAASTLFNRFWPEGGSAPVSEADLQRVGSTLFNRFWPEGSPAPAPATEAALRRVATTLLNRYWTADSADAVIASASLDSEEGTESEGPSMIASGPIRSSAEARRDGALAVSPASEEQLARAADAIFERFWPSEAGAAPAPELEAEAPRTLGDVLRRWRQRLASVVPAPEEETFEDAVEEQARAVVRDSSRREETFTPLADLIAAPSGESGDSEIVATASLLDGPTPASRSRGLAQAPAPAPEASVSSASPSPVGSILSIASVAPGPSGTPSAQAWIAASGDPLATGGAASTATIQRDADGALNATTVSSVRVRKVDGEWLVGDVDGNEEAAVPAGAPATEESGDDEDGSESLLVSVDASVTLSLENADEDSDPVTVDVPLANGESFKVTLGGEDGPTSVRVPLPTSDAAQADASEVQAASSSESPSPATRADRKTLEDGEADEEFFDAEEFATASKTDKLIYPTSPVPPGTVHSLLTGDAVPIAQGPKMGYGPVAPWLQSRRQTLSKMAESITDKVMGRA